MKAININPGDVLELKPKRAAAYGMQSAKVTVKHTQQRHGYRVSWIVATDSSGFIGFYKPSDFKCI